MTWLTKLRAWMAPQAAPRPSVANVPVAEVIASIRAARLSYCGAPKLENIAEALQLVQAARVPGRYLEAGVALGGSAILIARMKPAAVPLDLHDVFGMIPPPGPSDGDDAHRRYEEIRSGASAGIGGDAYYGYRDNLMEQVLANLRQFGIDLQRDQVTTVPGLFEDTLRPVGPVAFAHLDCDWYDSVRVCIERITPVLSVGGMMVFDDYSSYSGCKRAVDEWLAADSRFERVFHRRSLGLRRVR